MKFKKLILIINLLLIIITCSIVSASDNITDTADFELQELENTNFEEITLETASDETLSTNETTTESSYDEIPSSETNKNISDPIEKTNTSIKFSIDSQIIKNDKLRLHYDKTLLKNPKSYINIYFDDNYTNPSTIYEDAWSLYLDTNNLSVGKHACRLDFSGHENYTDFSETFKLEVFDLLININKIMYTQGDEILLQKNATGNITLIVNGTVYRQYDVEKDSYNIDYSNLKSIYWSLNGLNDGDYEITIKYNGNYGNITKKENMTLDYQYLEIYTGEEMLNNDLSNYLKNYNEDFLFFSILNTQNPKGNISVFIDDVDIHYDPTHNKPGSPSRQDNYYNGESFKNAPIWFSEISLSSGNHTLEIVYSGDDNLPEKNFKYPFYYEKSKLGVFNDIVINSSYPIKFLFSNNTIGNFSVYTSLDDINYELEDTVEIINNHAIAHINLTTLGEHYIKVVYNTNKVSKELNGTINVVPAILKFNDAYESRYYYWNENLTISKDEFVLECGEGVTGELYVYMKSKNSKYKLYDSAEIKNNSAKVTLNCKEYLNKEGEYQEKIVWKTNYGNYTFYPQSIIVSDGTGLYYVFGENYNKDNSYWRNNIRFYGEKFTYSLEVTGRNGETVGKNEIITFILGNHKIKVKTDKNGVATLKLPKSITPGTYKIKAQYKSAIYPAEWGNEQLLTVKQILTIEKVKVKKSAKKLTLTAKLKEPLKNKKITFKFNGKKYTAKTNKNGVAKITIKKSVLKKLKIGKKLTYSATYYKDTVKKTVKIKK